MHQPFQVMLVQYSSLGKSHYYLMNQCNLTLKDNFKEEIQDVDICFNKQGHVNFVWNVPHFLITPIPCPMILDKNVCVFPLLMFYRI